MLIKKKVYFCNSNNNLKQNKMIDFWIWKDGTISYKKGDSIYTEKIVAENDEYYTVVEIGAGEKLWNAGYAVGNRVYRNPIDLTTI